MAKKPNGAERGGDELQGYTPGADPAQAVHDKQLASLNDDQLDGLAEAIQRFMDARDKPQPQGALSTAPLVAPYKPKQ